MDLRVVLFFMGIIILLMGALPIVSETVPAAKGWMEGIPAPGTFIFQAVLIVLGVVALSYSIRGNGKRISKADFAKALGVK